MYLYYVVATEQTKDRKGNVAETENTHAIFARDADHLAERCAKLFVKFSSPMSSHKLSNDWNKW